MDGQSTDPILNMRGRVAQCRRLADAISDARTVEILLKMASDIEADILRIEAERGGRALPPKPPPC